MKNMNDIAKVITMVEGKKQRVSIAQVKEILKIFAILCVENPKAIATVINYGERIRFIPTVEGSGKKFKGPMR